MSPSEKAQTIKTPNLLASKLTVDQEDAAAKFARAETALAGLQDDYISWAKADIAKLKEILAMTTAGSSEAEQRLRELFRITHDMKGQGETFGYPLATRIGESLSRLLVDLDEAGDTELAVIANHVDALSVVIQEQIEDDGGEIGCELVRELEAAVEKLLTRKGSASQSGCDSS